MLFKENDIYNWHRWWAWHPVVIDTDTSKALVFFEHVERRRAERFGAAFWEYRPAT
jgi:hypothetical protein